MSQRFLVDSFLSSPTNEWNEFNHGSGAKLDFIFVIERK